MITFRPIDKEDLLTLKLWRNSDSVRPYVREYRYLNLSDQESWYESYLQSRRKSDFDQEIGFLMRQSDHLHIGVGGFTRIEWRNRRAELTYYTNPDIVWNSTSSIKAAIEFLINKGFYEFGFHKITWPVYAHDPHLDLYKSIFDVEAILKDEYFWDGKFQDRIYLSKLSSR